MDEKHRGNRHECDVSSGLAMKRSQRPHPPRRVLFTLLAVILSCLWFFHITWGFLWRPTDVFSNTGQPCSQTVHEDGWTLTTNKTLKVPLEAHIMSKCPDAKDCLRILVVPAMEKVADKVDFRLSFIGEVDKDDYIHCKHGPSECLGNIISLCAAHLYPNNTMISLGFSTCMISSYTEIPARSLIEHCSSEHGVDFHALNGCISEEGKGLDLLRGSVDRSKNAGVKYSCTVRLDDNFRCIRDGGEWKDCEGGSKVEDLVGDVEKLYKAKNARE